MNYPVLDTKAIGARIKALRKENHLTVGDIAEYMGFESEQAVYKWQRGDSLPTVDNLYALSVLFETSVDSILIGDREEDEDPSLSVFMGGNLTIVNGIILLRCNENEKKEIAAEWRIKTIRH